MTTSRIPVLPTNLKERIAALEQKAGNGGPNSRPTSPTGNLVPNGTSIPSAGNFRDKIAKFERKGGIPVPRGRFGLGAPPTSQGPKRQGELYGNRIPAPARTASIGIYPSTRPTSPTGDSSPATATAPADRRSFSLSNISSDFDDQADYATVSSPTFTLPPDSPESMISQDSSPQHSPSLYTNGDNGNFKRGIVRGTSFQKALEIARNAEVAKLEGFDPLGLTARQRSFSEQEEVEVEEPESTPIIVVSSSEDATHVVMHEPSNSQVVLPTTVHDDIDTSDVQELADESSSTPQLQSSQETVEVEVKPPDVVLSSSPVPEEVVEVKVFEAPAPTVPAPDDANKVAAIVPSPSVVETETPKTEAKEIQPVVPVAIEIAPLTVRKRRPTLPGPESPQPSSHEPMPSKNLPLESIAPPATEVPPETKEVQPVVEAPITVSPPPSDSVGVSGTSSHTTPTTSIETRKDDEPIKPKPEFKAVEPKVKVEEELPPSQSNPPRIVVHNEQSVETKHDDFNSRKAALSLNADLLSNDLIVSPPLPTGMSDVSLSEVIGNYFTGGIPTGEDLRSTTPPPAASTIMSSPAKLAYDVQDSPPPARPRPKKETDMQSFLSPPQTGALSGAPSSAGSSFSAVSSLGSRTMSMIETSPGHINRALRMTPATGRGVPVFLPPNSSLPRKSDFVYFPPTPDAEETEFGSVTMHKSSQSLFDGRRRGSEPELGGPPATFTAVVHDKVKDSALNRRYIVPETPQSKRTKVQAYLEPLSPGQGELTALLQEAVWLEDTLNKGELPSDSGIQKYDRDLERARLEAIEEETANAKEEERKRIAYATEQLKHKRDEPTSGRLKHTFLIPLTKARSAHRKEASAPKLDSKAQGDVLHPRSASATDKSGTRAMPNAGSTQVQRPVTPEKLEPSHTGDSPSKSPKSRFNGFRRLGNMSRAHTINGASVRHSISTISSEDSQPVATPPQGNLEFGVRSVGEFGQTSNNSTTSFPSLSPKKSLNNLGRAASFAEKMWSRARTKSSGSTLSASSEMTIDEAPKLPPLGPPPALDLPSLPSMPLVVPPSPELKASKVLQQPPVRSTSLGRTPGLPPIPTGPAPLLPKMSTPSFLSHTSDISNDSLLPPPTPSDSSRPSSWISLSSAGSLPSPLFDKDLFDAFPSVPGTTPMPDFRNFPHRRDNSIATALNPNPSFDSALLSSAIHLSSSYKSAAAAAAPCTTTVNNNNNNNVIPSRGSTPTPTTAPR